MHQTLCVNGEAEAMERERMVNSRELCRSKTTAGRMMGEMLRTIGP